MLKKIQSQVIKIDLKNDRFKKNSIKSLFCALKTADLKEFNKKTI